MGREALEGPQQTEQTPGEDLQEESDRNLTGREGGHWLQSAEVEAVCISGRFQIHPSTRDKIMYLHMIFI